MNALRELRSKKKFYKFMADLNLTKTEQEIAYGIYLEYTRLIIGRITKGVDSLDEKAVTLIVNNIKSSIGNALLLSEFSKETS